MCLNLTSNEFQNQIEIFILSCKTGSETSTQTRIYAATTGIIKPRTRRGRKFHKSVFLAIYAYISRKATKAKESAADRVISNRLVKLKVF
jgi:hypothetical protein